MFLTSLFVCFEGFLQTERYIYPPHFISISPCISLHLNTFIYLSLSSCPSFCLYLSQSPSCSTRSIALTLSPSLLSRSQSVSPYPSFSLSISISLDVSFFLHPSPQPHFISLSLSFLLYTLSTPQSSSLVYNFFIFLSLNGFLSIPSPSHTRTSMPVFVSELRSVLRFSTSDSSEHHGEVLVTVSRQQCVCAALQDSHGAEMRCLCGG